MNEILIDYYRDKKYPGIIPISVEKILKAIKDGKFRTEIETARIHYNNGDLEQYTLVKGKLIGVTFSGTFKPTRSAQNLQNYTGLIIIDIDKCGDNLTTYLTSIKSDVYVYAAWLSPSGDGIKFLIRTDHTYEFHKGIYYSAASYFKKRYGIPVDTSGSDIPRLCYISYDPDLYFNINCIAYNTIDKADSKDSEQIPIWNTNIGTVVPLIHLNKKNHKNILSQKETLKKIYHFLKKRRLSITDNYDNWVRLAFAISNTFNYDFGYKWYIEFCRLDGVYFDEQESVKLINKSYESGTSISTFGTVIYLAKMVGYIPNSSNDTGKKRL